ncbi:MAG: phosphoenolpyruvate carboxykinase (ATP) [Nitrospinota bacterium]|nr:phosphoenolpyruvate carboxykinase (ATP) [Nitrospinota bacterium]
MPANKKAIEDLGKLGFRNLSRIYRNLPNPALYEEAIKRREGSIAHRGPLVVRTGQYTGRSPNDKFIVKEPLSQDRIWWGPSNFPMEEKYFDRLLLRLQAYWQGKDMFIQDCYAGADSKYRIPLRVITEDAWHSMFARDMFIRIHDEEELANHVPDYWVINAPRFTADPEVDGTNSEAFVVVHFGKRIVIIGGTSYAGEIKKSVFTLLNYEMPMRQVLSMHCSANIGHEGDVAIFFGLSGTGKTTLSADPERRLIGDDEHGWSDTGVFNFEGGCYAKVINLSREAEPVIFANTQRFGTILENVTMEFEGLRKVDLSDGVLTENTRAAFPITEMTVPNAELSGRGGHPENIFMLTADAFGVLPPISKLTAEQAMYHFISGYTAKVAGTERGIKEPTATFSTCFGRPFLALHPSVYAKLLGERIRSHKVNCWLLNTGWTGGPHGVGQRMAIQHSRALLAAAINGTLDFHNPIKDPLFGFISPRRAPGAPDEIMIPRNTWADKAAYDAKAAELARSFVENFKAFRQDAPEEIKREADRIGVRS